MARLVQSDSLQSDRSASVHELLPELVREWENLLVSYIMMWWCYCTFHPVAPLPVHENRDMLQIRDVCHVLVFPGSNKYGLRRVTQRLDRQDVDGKRDSSSDSLAQLNNMSMKTRVIVPCPTSASLARLPPTQAEVKLCESLQM